MKVYQITIYEYDTYSFSGISPQDTILFASLKGAEKWIEDNKYKPVEYVTNPEKEILLEEIKVNP